MPGRRAPRLFRGAVAVGIALVIGGGTYAYLGYQHTSGPAGTVRGYFAALARSDAAAALGYGDLPRGSHAFLTADVLREQQDTATITAVHVDEVSRTGARATVRYSYRLDFPGRGLDMTGSIGLHERDGAWRLDAAAVPVALTVSQASSRVTLAGAAVPDGPTLLFPGALPVRIDSPYLGVAPASAAVGFADPVEHAVDLEVSAAGRRTLQAALASRLHQCFPGAGASLPDCPLPTGVRAVPGSFRGTVPADPAGLEFSMSSLASGVIRVEGRVQFTGRYRVLDFQNLAQPRSGSRWLRVVAQIPARGPLVVHFQDET